MLNGPVAAQQDGNTQGLEVVIQGLDDTLQSNVQAYLKINRLLADNQPLPGEARLRWLHQAAEEDIRRALEPFGYYKPEIMTQLMRTATGWRAVYTIKAGPPLLIKTLDTQILGAGRTDAVFQNVLKSTADLAPGKRLNHEAYEALKLRLQNLATERGYFDAQFTRSEIRVDLDAYQAHIIVDYDTAQRYRFGDVTFKQTVLAAEFLQRYVDFQPGDPYDASLLLRLQSDLIDSDYFSEVAVTAPLENTRDHTVPIDVELTPRKQRKYTLGLGYGTDTGVRGRAGVEQRRVNRHGHRYEIQLLASQIKYSLAAEYVIPGADPRSDSWNIRSLLSAEDSDIKTSQTATFGISQQKQEGLWLKIASLDYQWERFDFGAERQTTQLLIGGLNWTRVDADPDRLNVSDGNRISFELRGGADFLLSDLSFLQATIDGKWIKSFTSDDRLIVRGRAGTTLIDDDDFDRLPATLRFFTGGDRSVRGYSLDAIGPVNDDDDVIGGKHLINASIEYERRIFDRWSVAAFIDAGDAFNDTPDLNLGVGIGVRWKSPIGPVRIDLGSGLDDRGDVLRLHFSIGPDL